MGQWLEVRERLRSAHVRRKKHLLPGNRIRPIQADRRNIPVQRSAYRSSELLTKRDLQEMPLAQVEIKHAAPALALSTKTGARLIELAAVLLILVANSGCADNRAGASSHSISPESSLRLESTPYPLPAHVRRSLVEFTTSRGLEAVRPTAWHMNFGPRIGSAWIADFGRSVCIVGGPDASSSVACFDRAAVDAGEAVSVLIGGPGESTRAVVAFGLVPAFTRSVLMVGGSNQRCDADRGIFSCSGNASRRIVYRGSRGKSLHFRIPSPPDEAEM